MLRCAQKLSHCCVSILWKLIEEALLLLDLDNHGVEGPSGAFGQVFGLLHLFPFERVLGEVAIA